VLPVILTRRLLLGLALSASCRLFTGVLVAEDEFALGVRTTEPETPAEQRKRFHLPPGFEIQLVATEPEINKPMNMAFDAIGRLWVTTSTEYPWPAPTNRAARDRLMIFDDFGPDGKARKVTEFAGGLNIPIGVYPFRTDATHWKAVVWSIPDIWLLEDTDGDGRADKRTVLYGPFDVTRDTHGNQASFRRGFDGWLYASHGFNNDSHVTAGDGSHVDLNSGNTYRVRLDRSHIEQHTHGQVNPFGLAWDSRGNLYSSDCHSAPIYQLLDGGYYPSFGKPHDGLGYAPVMLEHAHGSTAIDGALYYEDDLWPAEYKDMFLIGNVMTSRLNRDRIEFHGSTPKAVEQPDFLTSTDPWFRPVDNILGPDGALYVADFYNRIIGHYEVPLTHPGRDRERGRLWRVVYKGSNGQATLRPAALAQDLDGLVVELGSPSLPRRLLAQHEIEDRFGTAAVAKLQDAARGVYDFPDHGAKVRAQIHALWALLNLEQLDDESLGQAWNTTEPMLRIHGMRMLSERAARLAGKSPSTRPFAAPENVRALMLSGLEDSDALVRRCAAEALGLWPSTGDVRPILNTLAKTDAADTHLLYVLRKSLRDHLAVPAIFDAVLAGKDWSPADVRAVADVAVAVPSAQAAQFLLQRIAGLSESTSPTLGEALKHAARHAPEAELPGLASFVRSRFAGQLDFQLSLFHSIEQGLAQRGVALPAALKAWGSELAGSLLAGDASSGWGNVPLEGAPTESPWDFQERRRSDGSAIRTLSSLMRGEPMTGTLRSPEFAAGPVLAFWLCGHDGYPDKPAKRVNSVRLRDAAGGAVLFEAWPPRNDAAVQVRWDTAGLAGKRLVLEVADGDAGDAYAWLAIGGIEGGPALPPVSPRALADRTAGGADLAARLGLREVVPQLRRMVARPGDPEARAAAARGLATLAPSEAVEALAPIVGDAAQPIGLRERLGVILGELNLPSAHVAVTAAFKAAPYRVQQSWAVALAGNHDGAEAFLQAVGQGLASPRLLQLGGVRNRIQRAAPLDWQARLETLTRGIPAADEARDKLIAARRNAYALADAKAAAGQKIFEVNCAACHQVDGKGGLVGPQLTGIGNRGLERLCEDILDPNRNVDHAFRQSVLTLKDGETMSGLFRREEGGVLVLANAAGAEFTVPKPDVVKREESPLSLMPENFGEAILEADFHNLLAFLLSRR